jgi:hypothetical protein
MTGKQGRHPQNTAETGNSRRYDGGPPRGARI